MRFILRTICVVVVCLFVGYYTDLFFETPTDVNSVDDKAVQQGNVDKNKTNESGQKVETQASLAAYINKDVDLLIKEYGDPKRVDAAPYSYQNYIFHQTDSQYMQVGVMNKKVQTIYALGDKLPLKPFEIDMPTEKVFLNMKLQSEITFNYEDNYYRFELSEDELNIRPLISLGHGVYAQVNFDKFESKVISVRYFNKLSLIKMHPYEMTYQGDIFKDTVTDVQWDKVDKASDQQVFDISNIFRERYGKGKLSWNEDVAQVAYGHSVDMYENKYFDHDSPTYGTLADRMNRANIDYMKAAENIASNYLDGPAAVEGWLNSAGHRKNLFDNSFTNMGAGTYRKFYTQNFLQK
ncbi:CAP domain-containing protein [Listeria rocourtiae]|uniref:CAP domain-containing protein n=1 Tax=Listeria rocourtiae TaxID=647910 RepID=UPI00162371AB|nr:CAP domain-containing protein [Listeria rocourtiae]MBC1603306.1 CAP domain-containing protein [Listeria rocourtiae]